MEHRYTGAATRIRMMEFSTLNPVVKSFLAGSASGTCSTLVFQPLDLVKTRLQQNLSQPRLGGTLGVVRAVVGSSDRGVLALWNGLVPSITRTVPGVGIYFGSLEMLKSERQRIGLEGGMAVDFALGVAARVMSATIVNPFSVIKTRYESRVFSYRGLAHALVSICRWEGTRGFFCGLLPTVVRDAPYSGCYYMFYTQLKLHVTTALPEDERLLLCKLMAGAMACLVTHPADVVKTQMQLYPNQNRSLRQTVANIARQTKLRGFAVGFLPRMVRRTLITALAWTIYESVMSTKTKRLNE